MINASEIKSVNNNYITFCENTCMFQIILKRKYYLSEEDEPSDAVSRILDL